MALTVQTAVAAGEAAEVATAKIVGIVEAALSAGGGALAEVEAVVKAVIASPDLVPALEALVTAIKAL